MKRLLSIILCFIVLMSSTIQTHAKVNNVFVSYDVGKSDESIKNNRIKIGNNRINISGMGAYHSPSRVRFIAPKSGAYKFVLKNIKSDDVEYPVAEFRVYDGDGSVARLHYDLIKTKIDGEEVVDVGLVKEGWSGEHGYNVPVTSNSFKLKLKKGQLISIQFYNLRYGKGEDLKYAYEDVSATIDCKVSRSK